MWGSPPIVTVHKSVRKQKFQIETLSKMIDSSVKNLEEVEFDTQNRLQRQKIQAWPNMAKWGLPSIATVRKSIHNKKVPS